MSKNSTRGEGRFYVRGNKIWVEGMLDGDFVRKSTGKDKKYFISWAKNQKPLEVLSNVIAREKEVEKKQQLSFENFGLTAIRNSSHKRQDETHRDYESIFKKWILPVFKNYRLDQLKAMDIESWQNPSTSQFRHLSFDRKVRIRSVLDLIFSVAERNDLIENNPCKIAERLTRPLAERNRKIQVYSLSQIKTIIEQSEGWLKVYFLLSFTTGMRVGEILGLKWVDFDLEEGLLNLERSRNKGKEVGSSKTKDHERTIALFPEVLEELRYFATNPLHEEYLFVNTRQQPWYDSKALRKNAIEPFFTKHKIPYLKLKATRASCITNLVKAGVPLPFVQSMVGHSKGSRVTIKHYFDSDETIEEKKENALNAAAKLNQRLLASA